MTTTFCCHLKNIDCGRVTELSFCSGYDVPTIFQNLPKRSFTHFTCRECTFPLRLNIFRLFVILSLTQLYRYTPEIFLFSTATFKYTLLRRIGQEYSANVASSTFQSLKRIQPLPVCAGFFICIRNSLDRPCVTMPS